MKSPRILLCYQHYPYSIGLLFKRGFQKLGATVKSLGHCTGTEIPWGKDVHLIPDVPDIRMDTMRHLYRGSEWLDYARDFDLVINIDAGHHFQGRDKFKKIIVGTDPHAIAGYGGRREDCDWFVCMQKCYSAKGDFWLPYAYDNYIHYMEDPIRTMKRRSVDVVFGGVIHPGRRADLASLRGAKLNVDTFTGLIDHDYRRRYWQAKLAYATPTMNDLPARFFESMAIGVPPVIREVPDIKELGAEPWVQYIPANDRLSLVDNCKKALSSEMIWEGLLLESQEWVRPHTWERRASQLLQLAGFLSGDPEDHKGPTPRVINYK